jgi:TPR repeat protein
MDELLVFVASPSDVQSERDLLEGVVDEINEMADETGHILKLVRWEKDVRPGVGKDPQEVVSRRVRDADITIVVFWKRLGTPTNRASSGTVEEFQRAVAAALVDPSREVFTYFKTALIHVHEDDLDQASRVKAFREAIDATTLAFEFRTGAEFRNLVSRHLVDAVLDRTAGDAHLPPEGQDAKADLVRGLLARRNGDAAGAVKSLRLAAQQDNRGAIFALAMTLRKEGNAKEADNWFRRAWEDGNATAAYNVGLRLRETGDRDGAVTWLRRGAEGGDVSSMYNLGMVLKEKGDKVQAEPWLLRGAEGGDVQAMYNAGLLRKEADDREAAELWFRRGAEGGDVDAMYDLGRLLQDGYGDAEAQVWVDRARERGHA